jgi:hypothetical protein
VVNGQENRITPSLRYVIRTLGQLFNDPTFWNNACVIFTRCFNLTQLENDKKQNEFRSEILNLIAQCHNSHSIKPSLPVFLIDAKQREGKNDEFERIVGFGSELAALSMNQIRIPYPSPWTAVKEKKARVLANTRIEGNRRIQTYEDQEREKRTLFDSGLQTYSAWKAVKSWDEEQTSETATESKTICLTEERRHKYHLEVEQRPHCFGTLGTPEVFEVSDGEDVVKRMAVIERTVVTDFDGNVRNGDWQIVRTYNE